MPRKRDKAKAALRNLFHHDASRQSDPLPSQSSTTSINHPSTPIPRGNTEPATNDSEPLPPLISPPKEPSKETFLQSHPNVTSFVKESLEVAAILAEASTIPGLSLAVGAIQHLLEYAEKLGEHRDQVFQLGNEAAVYADSLHQILKLRPSEGATQMDDVSKRLNNLFEQLVRGLLSELDKTTKVMNEITAQNTSRFAELWNQSDIGNQIKERMSALKDARETFMILNSALNGVRDQHTLETVKQTLEIVQQLVLDQSYWDTTSLPYLEAAYNQDTSIRTCHEMTRVLILESIYAQLSSMSSSDARIVWVRASAGSGKSTIARTVADYLERKGWLAGSFFFSRNIPLRSGMKNLFATLANQLAVRDKRFAAELIEALKADPELRYAEPSKQLMELLVNPLKVYPQSSTTFRPHIFVLDALDECGSDQGETLVKLLLPHLSKFPSSFRFLVTSRPEAPLIGQLSSSNLSVQTINIDQAIHEQSSRADIYIYLFAELKDVEGLEVLDSEIAALAVLADGLFQFAATAVRMIRESRRKPRKTLDLILKIERIGSTDPALRVALNNLYGTIFNYAYSLRNPNDDGYTKGDDDDIVRIYHLVIGGVVHVREPVSIKTLAVLVDVPEEDVKLALQPLSSVLLLPDLDNPNAPIRIRHLSFTEYITDPAGALSRHHPLYVIDDRTKANLAEGTFSIMASQLHFNISNSVSSSELNKHYDPSHFEKAIPEPLAYACRFWMFHLESVPQGMPSIVSLVMTFMDEKLLFWLEALSALEAVTVARAALEFLNKWLEPVDPKLDDRVIPTKPLVRDAIKFIQYFAPVIAQSAPHTYLSTLPFAPTTSLVVQHYSPQFQNLASLEIGQLSDWPARRLVFHGHSDGVKAVSVSPSGKRVASGSDDNTIRIWDVETGQTVVGPLEGHSSNVDCVAFSPDGKLLVSGSSDHTIRVWNAETGQIVEEPLKGHSSWVKSVAFSPDGTRIVSGSGDQTIRIWDVKTGMTAVGPLEGHSNTIFSAAFSPDGKLIVSGSADSTVRIWDVETGRMVVGPLEGHSGEVNSVAFSPDGKLVASGSDDKTIRIWDAQTGQMVSEPFSGHSDFVISVSFSPNGKLVVSGSRDQTIRVWDVATGQTIGQPFEGHSNTVYSVTFSPNGANMVSGSLDRTVRIWDMGTDQTVKPPVKAHHSSSIYSIAFSPDGKHIASGSADHTVRIWDAETGQMVVGPLEGHSNDVRSVAFSPDGQLVVSGSDDKTIRIWDVATGNAVGQPFEGHSDFVISTSFSPNAQLIVSGSTDETIRVWDVVTGYTVGQPFEGHTDFVNSVVFSPDGKYLASGSGDQTVRIWDVKTGMTVVGPLEGHSNTIFSVAFSPDGKLVVSGSEDNKIRVWDAETGQPVGGPFEGHSNWIRSVAFSPDGTRVVSGSEDKTIRLWDVKTGQMVAGPFEGHSHWVFSVAFSPDGEHVASGSWDNTIRILNPATSSHWQSFGDQIVLRDGWVKGPNDELLLWIPPLHRQSFHLPNTVRVIGPYETRVDSRNAVWGKDWTGCYISDVA